ncbi:hypothetical protein [Paraurantiacibacter namhicola]|uniref:Uncharacterized protein n=1 Tax=Paraurantiacibacter namhicola TaxID=645517 RepID=A0A1C7D7D8_9SPHN|nr:hypothetical protein [Paraurantiacibacter namhicola]ANU07272.1 hypothetical protein A6F65_00962 [Paraurantiacibacter namhicola]
MSQTYEFYTARAKECATEAAAAKLDNVRERALRSEATWRGLADQARAVAEQREKIARDKAALREIDDAQASQASPA